MIVTFASTKTDSDFLRKSIRRGNMRPYYLDKQRESTAIDDPYFQDITSEEPLLRKITGPDTDCWEAIDVPALIKALNNIKTSRTSIEYRQQYAGLENSKDDMAKWTEYVQEMRQYVEQWLTKEYKITEFEINRADLTNTMDIKDNKTILPNLCFIEGFLLYTDPGTTAAPAHIQVEHNTDLTNNRTPIVLLHDVCRTSCHEVEPSEPQTPDDILPGCQPSCVQTNELMSLFDMKLFLPTSRDVAKVRRFSRTPYMDHPYGKRIEGQYWKTEGYFDGVAWPNYEKFHRWLLNDSNDNNVGEGRINHNKHPDGETVSNDIKIKHWEQGDVHIREVDAGVEDTLRWAVGIILAEISKQRHKFSGQKRNE